MAPKKRSGGGADSAPAKKKGPIRLDDPASFPAQTSVRILIGAHAGKTGTTMGFDNSDGFYEVALDGGGAGLLFLPRSSLLPRYEIILIELEKAELNKYMATVEGWDTDSKRYEVCLHADKRTLKLQPKNVLLPEGARVCIDGLQGAAHYNGIRGKVRDFDCDSGRYEIEYVKEDGELGVLKLKRENALLYTAPKLEVPDENEEQ